MDRQSNREKKKNTKKPEKQGFQNGRTQWSYWPELVSSCVSVMPRFARNLHFAIKKKTEWKWQMETDGEEDGIFFFFFYEQIKEKNTTTIPDRKTNKSKRESRRRKHL